MTHPSPAQEWWTAEGLGGSGLPDVPASRQGVEALAQREGWRGRPGLARRRAGKGGGWEYHWTLLPVRAQRKLVAAAAAPDGPRRIGRDRDEAWAWFEGLPEQVQAEARRRLLVIQKVEALEPGMGRHLAVKEVARLEGAGARTIWGWFSMIDGVRPDDRLAWLAPRHRAAPRRAAVLEFSPEFFDLLKSDYLRLEQPTFADCYRRAVRVARKQGWDILPERTMRRRLEATVSKPVLVLARKGVEALKRMYPPQVRDKTALTAMEAVNGDFHKIDVFVRWPGIQGHSEPQIVRPQIVAFQDIHSGRILSWRVDVSANSTAVLLAAGDMIERWGIPQHVVLDNGREFAAKAVTGGASTRFRFKVREDDIPGLFTSLACEIHWATPYSGQSKPIERAFRDWAQSIAKDPRFAGAYTGPNVEAKPGNYASAAIPLDVFLRVLAEGIEEHNSRQGRRSEVAWGRSFAEVFDASYETAPIRKATEVQRRFWLLGAEGLSADRTTGQIAFQGNGYWDHWAHEIAGRRVIARFDPADLHAGIHVYAQDNSYLGFLPCRDRTGFFDIDEARSHARARADWIAAEKKAALAHRRLTAAQVGAAVASAAPAAPPAPDSKVVRLVFGKPATVMPDAASAPAAAPISDDVARVQAAIVADLAAHRAPSAPSEETERDRFRRALDMEKREAAGGVLTTDQARWLSAYQASSEYRAQRALYDDFGETFFG